MGCITFPRKLPHQYGVGIGDRRERNCPLLHSSSVSSARFRACGLAFHFSRVYFLFWGKLRSTIRVAYASPTVQTVARFLQREGVACSQTQLAIWRRGVNRDRRSLVRDFGTIARSRQYA